MPPDRDAFLRAVVARPDDDLPRLVYSDWLDEHGESARAEFIRLQCGSARLPEGHPQAVDLDARAEALLAEHERDWLGDWYDGLVRWTFRRGFLDGVEIEPGPFLDRGAALLDGHPVRRVKFIGPDGDGAPADAVPELAAAPHLARVRALDFSGNSPGPAWARAIAAAAHLTNLEELNFFDDSPEGEGFLGFGGLRALAAAPHLTNLRTLNLGTAYGRPLGDNAVGLVAAAAFADRLTSLVLRNGGITDAGVSHLAGDVAFANLEQLDLVRCDRVTPGAVRQLFASPHLTRLTDLAVSVRIDLRELAHSPRLGRLCRLCLSPYFGGGAFRPEDWATLAASPHLRLSRLQLSHCDAGEPLLDLLRSPGLSGIRDLAIVGEWRIGNGLVESLTGQHRLPNLTALSLSGCHITERGVRRLAASPVLTQLAALDLSTNDRFGPGALQALLASPHLSERLGRLDLDGCRFDGVTVTALAACPRLAGLIWLSIPGPDLTGRAAEALLTSPHLERLTYLDVWSVPDARAAGMLARPGGLPRLRKLFLGSQTDPTALAALRRRFGPRLRVYPDE
jgi:uncharacterized protein (TIGR02996 family)